MKRSSFAGILLAALLVPACTALDTRDRIHPPVVFVHGAFGNAALWAPAIWRFESNGWPRDRLFAVDITHPRPRSDDGVPMQGRTSAAEHTAQVAAEVERVLKLTGASKVVLVGNSRAGLAIRDFVRNGGAAKVSHVVLGGTPNRGLWIASDFGPNHESNGAGRYMTSLNSPQGPDGLEVTPGVRFMTLRSDGADKYTQPDGRWLGQPKLKTNLTHDAPALKGAENVVLQGADHLEVSYGPGAFLHTYRFITGSAPQRVDIVPESRIVLEGLVTGWIGDTPSNVPIAGATVEVYEVAPQTGERLGGSAHVKTTGSDGAWGPLTAKPGTYYEFVVRADGYATTHIFRSPFPRSSRYVHLRPVRLGDADRKAASVVVMNRPRGFFGPGRDRMSLDGKEPPGLPAGVPGESSSTLRLADDAARSVVAELNGERIVVRTWPTKDNRLVRAEFHY